MADQRRAGAIQLQIDGEIHDCKGSFTYGFGIPKREAIVGPDRVHGYKETPQVAFIEGAITDRGDLDVKRMMNATAKTVTLKFANGKMFVLSDAWFAGDGQATTEEAEIEVRWEGIEGEES